MTRVLISGGDGLLGRSLIYAPLQIYRKEITPTPHELSDRTLISIANLSMTALGRDQMDITSFADIQHALADHKPDVFIHCGAYTTPMADHERWPIKSIDANIIGTANVARACLRSHKPIYLIYISTDYVYPGYLGPYPEDSRLNPINHYARSKLAGELAVQMFPRHLILRCAFTQRPFKHKGAFTDSIKSYLYADQIAPIILALVTKRNACGGIVNVGGERQSIYDFAKQSNPHVRKLSINDVSQRVPRDTSMDTTLLKAILA